MTPPRLTAALALPALLLALAAPAAAQGPPPKIEGRAGPPATPPGLEAPDSIPAAPRAPGERGVRGLRTGNALPGQAEPPATPPGLEDAGPQEELPAPPRRPGERIRGPRGGLGLSTGNALPGQAEPPATPPGLEGAGQPEELPAPPQNRRATPQALLQRIQELPGGAARVQEARRRAGGGGAAPAPGAGLMGLAPADGSGWLEAEAPAPAQEWSVVLTPMAPRPSGGNYMYLYGGTTYSSPEWRYLYASYGNSTFGSTRSTDYVYVGLNVPDDGWYILNTYGYMNSSTTFDVMAYSSAGWQVLEAVAPGTSAWQDQPVLLELGAGYHYFVVRMTGSQMILSAIEAFKVEL